MLIPMVGVSCLTFDFSEELYEVEESETSEQERKWREQQSAFYQEQLEINLSIAQKKNR